MGTLFIRVVRENYGFLLFHPSSFPSSSPSSSICGPSFFSYCEWIKAQVSPSQRYLSCSHLLGEFWEREEARPLCGREPRDQARGGLLRGQPHKYSTANSYTYCASLFPLLILFLLNSTAVCFHDSSEWEWVKGLQTHYSEIRDELHAYNK